MTLEETWYIGEALTALARNLAHAACFSKSDLSAWCPEIGARRRAPNLAIRHLRLLGFIVPTQGTPGKPILAHGLSYYAVTEDGIDAAKSAQAEALRQARANSALKMSDRTRAASKFAARLWSLVRMRQTITAEEAATLLTDAGDDVETAKRRTACYLRTWSAAFPDALQVSAKRIDGFKRYVLLKDLGPSVPAVSLRGHKAREGAAA